MGRRSRTSQRETELVAVVDLAGELDRAGAIVEEARWPAFDLGDALASTGTLIGMAIGAFENDDRDRGDGSADRVASCSLRFPLRPFTGVRTPITSLL